MFLLLSVFSELERVYGVLEYDAV